MPALPSTLALLAWLASNLATLSKAERPEHRFVVLAFDGIAQNHLDKEHTPYLWQLAADSTTTEWMFYQFPSQTLPNLQSIATGLYPDVHGVRADQIMVDGSDACVPYGMKMYTQRPEVLPIWTLNELTGDERHSGVVAWPGFEFMHQNTTNPTYQIKATDCKPWTDRVDQVIQWLTDAKAPANLILMHFESNETSATKTMTQADDIVKHYFNELHEKGMRDKVNTIIVSDNTQAKTSVGVMPVCGQQTPNYTSNCHTQIWKSFEEASKELNAFKVLQYAKLKSNFLSEAISGEAEGYLNNQQNKLFLNVTELLSGLGLGEHNAGMFPMFIANGPLFEPKHKAAPFENVDIYALISKKLELKEPTIKINGSYDNIQNILLKDKPVYEDWKFKAMLYVIVILLLAACGWYILKIRKQERLRF